MARVTAQQVKKIIDVDAAITDISPFIRSANLLVTQVCSGSGYSADLLAEIELWLAAHFIAIRDPRMASETVGDAGGSYAISIGQNLAGTTFGQQAMLLDVDGNLSRLNKQIASGKKITPSITWLGTEDMAVEEESE